MELNNIRGRIDQIDTELAQLLRQRMDLCAEVAASKKQSGKEIRDHAREREIINRTTQIAGETYAPYVKDIYKLIMQESRSYQSRLMLRESAVSEEIGKACESGAEKRLPNRATVACQGSEGAYAQQACERIFEYPSIMYFNSFDSVFRAVESGMCEYGILPIENSTAGSVTQVYDLMEKHSFRIAAACRLAVVHKLMRRKGTCGKITEIYSHEQALRQCSDYLAEHTECRAIQMPNTASAAEYVANSDREDVAVIASAECAQQYGLEIVEEEIANEKMNTTRFICISQRTEIYPAAKKISIMFNLPHHPGSLNDVISRLNLGGVNLTKIESRPIAGRDFEFRFFFDMEADPRDPEIIRLMGELAACSEHFVFLGAYEERK